jgi:hypothetical protein
VPKWRLAIYVFIGVAIPVYFSNPHLGELHDSKLLPLFCFALLLPVGMVMFCASLPLIAKKHKAWIIEHKTLLLRLVYVAIALNVLLKLLDMFHAKSLDFFTFILFVSFASFVVKFFPR